MELSTIIAVIVYIAVIGYLGFRGFRATRTTTDYLIGGRQIHPYVMAMSYGATFISTSAIVGFGGAAAVFGMGLLWLTFLNIFVGVFIAFIFFGGRTRRMGLRLDAHTFPELLGRRYDSKFIQMASGLLIFVFMPLYASAVMIGAAAFLSQQLGIEYNVALFVFAIIIASYVVMGGLKGVMYADALQGSLMLLGMVLLLVFTYVRMGGVTTAHQALTDLAGHVPARLAAGGHQGWTRMPTFGTPVWWTLVSTIVLGVGIGVLAQPQLAVRYMTVKSGRELNRAVPIGGVFILMMTGVAFVVGALTNVHFMKPEFGGTVAIAAAGGAVERIIPMYLRDALPRWFGMLFMLTLLSAAMSTLSSQFHAMGTSIGRDFYEQLAPRRASSSGILVTRLGIVLGIIVSVALGYWLEMVYGQDGMAIVARGTALFFGLCASAFLPMYVGGLWSRRITRSGAIAGMLSGAGFSLFWMLFVEEKASAAFGLAQRWLGRPSLGFRIVEQAGEISYAPIATGWFYWAFVDPVVVALPLAIAVTLVVSRFTRRMDSTHLDRCFGNAS